MVSNNSNLSCHIDWLNFTFRPELDFLVSHNNDWISCLIDVFPFFDEILNSCIDFEKAQHMPSRFYNDVIIFNDNVRLSFNNLDANRDPWQQGVLVEIPSHGLEWFLNFSGCSSLPELLKLLDSNYCKITRIDLAYDDFTKRFKPIDFNLAYLNRMNGVHCSDVVMITNYRKSKLVTSEMNEGHTFYLGSRSSCLLRVYDKNYESGGAIDAIRYEFECHGELAIAVARHIMEFSSVPSFRSCIDRMFRLHSYNGENRFDRLPLYQDWYSWLNEHKFNEEISDFDITRYSVETKPINALKWALSSNVLRAVAKGIAYFGRDTYFGMAQDFLDYPDKATQELINMSRDGFEFITEGMIIPF